MPTKVYTLTETTDRTGYVLAVFADCEQAIEVARSNADHRIRRCIATDEKLFNATVGPATYEAVLLSECEQSRVVIRYRPTGEHDAIAWHISPFDIVEPALRRDQTTMTNPSPANEVVP